MLYTFIAMVILKQAVGQAVRVAVLDDTGTTISVIRAAFFGAAAFLLPTVYFFRLAVH